MTMMARSPTTKPTTPAVTLSVLATSVLANPCTSSGFGARKEAPHCPRKTSTLPSQPRTLSTSLGNCSRNWRH